MPKLRQPYPISKPPQIDWLWAAMLERKKVLGYDLKMMAKTAGMSYELMRRYFMKSPWDWPREVREKICTEFGINISFKPDGLSIVEVFKQ